MPRRHGITVAVIGAGASGTLAAIQLLRRAKEIGTAVDIRLVDRSPTTGRGVAYDTTDPLHLLNVPVSAMGAAATEPDHFCRWLERTKGVGDPNTFVPRGWFGGYLEASLAGEVASSPSRFERITASVTGIHRRHADSTVRLDNGKRFRASHVILALGSPSGANQLLPPALLASPRFISDPWAPAVLDETAASTRDVLLLGTGLTMVDVALRIGRPGRTVTAISRRGLVPKEHTIPARVPVEPPPVPSGPLSLEDLHGMLVGHVKQAMQSGGCWQDAVDSVRPVTNELWSRLGAEDQERLIAGPMRTWEVLRHRMAPLVAERFRRLVETGAVALATGEVVGASELPGGVEVRCADGTKRVVSTVISCMGASSLRSSAGPLGNLVRDLERGGTIRLHRLGMGLVVDEVGRAHEAAGEVTPPIYVIGPLRRGALWETTAVPEILDQSDEVARHILAATAPQQVWRRPRDLYRQPLTTTGATAKPRTHSDAC